MSGILADTGFLYAASDTDDRLFKQALEVFELLEEFKTRIYANVISRMEFVDLIFRKQITIGAVETFQNMNTETTHKVLFNLLKSIRDENTAQRKDNQSYKIPEGRLKKLREQIELSANPVRMEEVLQIVCRRNAFQRMANSRTRAWPQLRRSHGRANLRHNRKPSTLEGHGSSHGQGRHSWARCDDRKSVSKKSIAFADYNR